VALRCRARGSRAASLKSNYLTKDPSSWRVTRAPYKTATATIDTVWSQTDPGKLRSLCSHQVYYWIGVSLIWDQSGRLHMYPVVRRRLAGQFTKNSVEMSQRLKTDRIGDLADPEVRIGEEVFCLLHPDSA